MDWKLEWTWESDEILFGSDQKYFESKEDATNFVETLKKNPNRKLTGVWLIHTVIIF